MLDIFKINCDIFKLYDFKMYRCLVILCFFASSHAFFFDIKSPIIYGVPGVNRTDYFGYSVALFGGRQPWIQIGAPRALSSNNLQSGVVYRCGISEICSKLNIVDRTELNGSFIGNSMDVDSVNNVYAVCGHRWTFKGGSDYYAQGACYSGSTNQTDTTQHEIFGKTDNTVTVNGRDTIYNYGQGQAGFSAQFMNDGSGSLIVGAPGTYNWAGLALLLKHSKNVPPPASRRTRRDLSDKLLPSGSSAKESYFSYFGYSVSSGTYFAAKDTLLAAGVPRSQMIGKVALFKFEGTEIDKKKDFQGHQFGEYFGGAMATADVNNDGKDDLIVGAPTYKKDKYDEGRVYIYYRDDDKNKGTPSDSITGESAGGRFGEAIAALGDIDYDGYEDIAVAAPNEDNGHGVVYIYRGSELGLRTTPVQKIEGKSFGNTIKGFGYSMSRATDIDGNYCKDLAIGAYQSGHAFLFRSRPVISLINTLTPSVAQIPTDDKRFTFVSCFDYQMKCKDCTLETTTVEVKIDIDTVLKRASIDNPIRNVTLGSVDKCQTYTVTLGGDNSHPEQPLKIFVSAKLVPPTNALNQEAPVTVPVDHQGQINGKDNFCRNCPVLDTESKSEFDYSVDFFLGCGRDNKCQSNLSVKPSFSNVKNNEFILGSEKHLSLATVVSNTGDKAYSTKLTLHFPEEISLRSVPSSCKENNKTSITCTVDNPLAQSDSKTVKLDFDMDNINSGNATTLDFELKIDTSSENINPEKTQSLRLNVIKTADVTLTGKSKDQYYYFENTSSVVEFGQVLQVQKEGPSPINDVAIDISIPTAYGSETFLELSYDLNSKCREITSSNNYYDSVARVDDSNAYLQQPNRTFYINCSNPLFVCSRYMCNTGRLSSSVYEIQMKFKFNVSNIADALNENDIIVFSTQSISAIQDGDIRTDSSDARYRTAVTSILLGTPMDKPIDLWIIIVSVIGGILLLVLIVGLLYKFGFFERKTKKLMEDELKNQENAPLTDIKDEALE